MAMHSIVQKARSIIVDVAEKLGHFLDVKACIVEPK
jgi:hypothetical protein